MQNARYIEVSAGVRYWEDATLNGEEDADGAIPLRDGDVWQPTIELATGRVLDWPEGVEARVHYKVCDEGQYWLLDDKRARIAKWKDHYVPNAILCVGSEGFGDYIILAIGTDGLIKNWKAPALVANQWEPLVPAPAVSAPASKVPSYGLKGQETPAARHIKEQFEEKYGDLSDVMRSIIHWRHVVDEFCRTHNGDLESPASKVDLDAAEDSMLAEIRRYAGKLVS